MMKQSRIARIGLRILTASLGLMLSIGMLSIGLSGCASNGGSAQAQAGPESSAPAMDQDSANGPRQSVDILNRQSGFHAKRLDVFTLERITSRSQFRKLGLKGIKPANFDQNDMVVLGMGQQSTAGYWVRITGLQTQGQTLEVNATANRPGKGAAVSQTLSQPFSIVTMPKLDRPLTLHSNIKSVTGQQP